MKQGTLFFAFVLTCSLLTKARSDSKNGKIGANMNVRFGVSEKTIKEAGFDGFEAYDDSKGTNADRIPI